MAKIPSGNRPCSERACVFEETVTLLSDNIRTIEVKSRNSGTGAASNASVRFQFLAVTGLNETMLKEQNLPEPTSSGTIPQGDIIATRIDSDETMDAHSAEIKNGDLPAFVYGQIEFDDEYGEHHYPRFCTTWSKQYNAFIACKPNDFVKGQKP
jgi:hypothetical protein